MLQSMEIKVFEAIKIWYQMVIAAILKIFMLINLRFQNLNFLRTYLQFKGYCHLIPLPQSLPPGEGSQTPPP